MDRTKDTQNIAFQVKVLSDAIGRQANRNMRGFNLTMQQMKILEYLKYREMRGETASQKDIQAHLKITHATTANMLRLLKEKEFVRICPDEADRRMRTVTLTGKETGMFEQLLRERRAMERVLLQNISPAEQETVRRCLQQMYQNVTAAETAAKE